MEIIMRLLKLDVTLCLLVHNALLQDFTLINTE